MKEISLKDSFTIFFYAFRTTKDFDQSIINGIWTESKAKPDGNFLLNHVQSFLCHNANLSSSQKKESDLKVFEINADDLDRKERDHLLLYNSFFKRTHQFDNNNCQINFFICQDKSMLSPKLFFIPVSGIGVLTFGIKLSDKSTTLKNLQELNYQLRVLSSRTAQRITTEKKLHPRAFEQENKIKEQLDLIIDTSSTNSSFIWSINSWKDYLLKSFKDHITTFSSLNMQAFSYVNLDDEMKGRELNDSLFRLKRVYSEQFLPVENNLDSDPETSQTFEKIHSGVSIEGAVIMVEADNNQFLLNYSQTVLGRSIWVYIIAYIQRFSLIAAMDDSAVLYKNNHRPAVKDLHEYEMKTSKYLFNNRFHEISFNSYQNDFYELCCRNLQLNTLTEEIKEKLISIQKVIRETKNEEEYQYRLDQASFHLKSNKLKSYIALLFFPLIWFIVLSVEMDNWVRIFNNNSVFVYILSGGFGLMLLWILYKIVILNKD